MELDKEEFWTVLAKTITPACHNCIFGWEAPKTYASDEARYVCHKTDDLGLANTPCEDDDFEYWEWDTVTVDD